MDEWGWICRCERMQYLRDIWGLERVDGCVDRIDEMDRVDIEFVKCVVKTNTCEFSNVKVVVICEKGVQFLAREYRA